MKNTILKAYLSHVTSQNANKIQNSTKLNMMQTYLIKITMRFVVAYTGISSIFPMVPAEPLHFPLILVKTIHRGITFS